MNPDGVTGGNIMEARYKKATIEDLDLLVDMRIKVLRAANMLSEETDMSEVRRCSYRYYIIKKHSVTDHIRHIWFLTEIM